MGDLRVKSETGIRTAFLEDYRETEIGPLPDEWNVVPLGDYLSLIRNGLSKKQNREGVGYPVTRIETISGDRINLKKVAYLDGLSEEQVEKYRLLPKDILFSHINSEPQLGRSVIYRGDPPLLLHGMNLLLLRTVSGLDSAFLNYLFSFYRATGVFVGLAGRAVNQSSINQGKLKAMLVPLPPLPEQKTISHILSTIQKAIETTEQVIESTRELKRSLMNHLFTYGPVAVDEAEQVPLKETETEPVPEHWETLRLAEVVDMRYGYSTSIPKSPPANGVKIISTAEIRNDGLLDLSKIRTVEMPEHLIDRYLVAKDDILFNWRNAQKHVGKAAIVENSPTEPTISASFIIRIRTGESINYRYLHYILTYLRQKGIFFKLSRRAVNQANFNANELGDLEISFPPLSTQQNIVDNLLKIDYKMKVEEMRKHTLEILFKTLLHNLMTGKVRVNDLDLSEVEEIV